jgi:hypothetical protein
MSILNHVRQLIHDNPEPALNVTERSVRDQLYGGRRTIDVAPREPLHDWLDERDLEREPPPAQVEYDDRPAGRIRYDGYDNGPADERTVEPREPDQRS